MADQLGPHREHYPAMDITPPEALRAVPLYLSDVDARIAVALEALPIEAHEARTALHGLREAVQHREAARSAAEGNLQVQSMTDPLTGLGNRRAVMFAAHRAGRRMRADPRSWMPRAGEEVQPTGYATLYADLDRFKPINDRYGHPRGDRMLVVAAAVMSSMVRRTDEVYRVGGDEFLIFMRLFGDMPTSEQVTHWANSRFREGIAAVLSRELEPFGLEPGLDEIDMEALRGTSDRQGLGASFGVLLTEGPHLDREAAQAEADKLMLQVKAAKGSRR